MQPEAPRPPQPPAAEGGALIEVRGLRKRFGLKTVLRGLTFRAAAGEFVALLGPNGAGKTTFLRILAGLSRPNGGEVRIAGWRLPQQAAAVRRRLGVVFHLPLLYGELTAAENLRFFGHLYGVEALAERSDALLHLVGLFHRRRDLVRTFSRGMQQRLAIARALLHEPDVLLLDEPYTGLDQDASATLDQVLQRVADQGHTIIMASHQLNRVAALATRFDVLSRGRVAASRGRADLSDAELLDFYRAALADTPPSPAPRDGL